MIAGRFQLGEWLGEGSVSVVHAAVDAHTGREVAVKLARESGVGTEAQALRRRFHREAAALSVIASPHVVELISAGSGEDGRAYLVLERLRGRDLEELLAEVGRLSPAQVARFLGQAASALELAHGLGIVHRDLKPANLFVHVPEGGKPMCKLLDFGMAVDTSGPTERGRDAFGGTPLYMAPEQVRGQLTRIGPATDVWALALTAVTLLTGERYWQHGGSEELLREIEVGAMTPPSARWPWLGPGFDAWFARSTQRVPERRFRSIAEQAARLAEALAEVRPPEAEPGGEGARVVAAPAEVAVTTPGADSKGGVERASLVGRAAEQAEVERLLGPGRPVTLTGPAGIGKSHLARKLCEALGDRFVDGAWFVPLGAGDAATVIPSAIAAELELQPAGARALLDHLVAELTGRHALVVLDGLEQLAGATAATVERLCRDASGVSWLFTSRIPLGAAEEAEVRLAPLELPAAGAAISAGEARTFAAVELFVQQARAARPEFVLADDQVEEVVELCRATGGSPLGIELAAARMAGSSPAAIRAAIEAGGPAGAERSAVRAAVEWSYKLLDGEEQRLLRRLALFPAGLLRPQIEALGPGDVTATVSRLVATHLVHWSEPERGRGRLLMLDSVRELCHELTADAGDGAAMWAAAVAHAEALALRGDDELSAWLARIDAEIENLRAVLAYLTESAPALALRLAGRLAYYWYLRGRYVEGGRWLEGAITRSFATSGEELVRALQGAGHLAALRCRYQHAKERLERARRLSERAGDARGEASALQLLAGIARERGDYQEALERQRQSLEIWWRLGDEHEVARARNQLVFVVWLAGATAELSGAELSGWWRREAEAELRRLGDPEGVVWALLNRGAILLHAGDPDAARESLSRAFAEAVAARYDEGIAWALDLIGLVSLDRGELLQAGAQLAACLRVHRRLGDLWRCASALEGLAAVAILSERSERGALLLGAADALRELIGVPVPACERRLVEAVERKGAEALGPSFGRRRAGARRLSLDEVLALIAEEGDESPPPAPTR